MVKFNTVKFLGVSIPFLEVMYSLDIIKIEEVEKSR